MKKLLNLLLTVLALLGTSCEQQGKDGADTPTTFIVDVANITINSATVNVVPPSNETYLFDVVARFDYEEFATPTDFAISRIEMLKGWADAQNRPLTELLVSGTQSREYDWLSADTRYYAYAFGVTAEGELSTDVVMVQFRTKPYSDEPSNNTFDIKVSEITAYGARLEVTPSNGDFYHFYVVEKAEYDKYESEEAFAKSVAHDIKSISVDVTSNLSIGSNGYIFNALLKPSTDYYAYALGISGNGVPTTSVTKVPFKTLATTNNEMVLDYFVEAYAMKMNNFYKEGVATWSISLAAADEDNTLYLDIQTPLTATDFVGSYTFDSSFDPNTAVVGAMEEKYWSGSCWYVYDNLGNLVKGKLFSSGSVNITKSDNIYTLSIDALDQNNEKLKVSYTGIIEDISL